MFWGLHRRKDSSVSCCGDWVDASASRQLTGTSDETPKDLGPLGALPGQRIPWSGPAERGALGWAVWWAGPQQRWLHRHLWTADRTCRPRAFQSLLREGKTHITHILSVSWAAMQWHMWGCGCFILCIYGRYTTLNSSLHDGIWKPSKGLKSHSKVRELE